MRRLTVVVASLAFLFLAARSAHAQNPCCGELILYHVDCGDCGGTYVSICLDGAGNTYAPVITEDCCTERIQSYAPAGACVNGIIRPLSPQHPASGETSMYVNVYVRDCKGQYVALRMAMARQAG